MQVFAFCQFGLKMPIHASVWMFLVRIVVLDAAYCYRPSSVVCQSVTVVNPAKPAEPI